MAIESLYDNFIADYYDASPIVTGRSDVAFYVDAPVLELGCGSGRVTLAIPFRPFQHLLETQQQLDCLECVRHQMETGGHLIVDLFPDGPARDA